MGFLSCLFERLYALHGGWLYMADDPHTVPVGTLATSQTFSREHDPGGFTDAIRLKAVEINIAV